MCPSPFSPDCLQEFYSTDAAMPTQDLPDALSRAATRGHRRQVPHHDHAVPPHVVRVEKRAVRDLVAFCIGALCGALFTALMIASSYLSVAR
jgi:hypothetical protein